MKRLLGLGFACIACAIGVAAERPIPATFDPHPKPLASDPSVKVDYDIVYVRAPRFAKGRDGKDQPTAWPEIGHPYNIGAGYDLMLLHPDGSEETLVEAGKGAVTDPYVSFDGKTVFYSFFHPGGGADIFKIHVPTRKVVRLTEQRGTPNTGVASWSDDAVTPAAGKANLGRIHNLGPCPVPGGRIAFVSDRDGFQTPRGYPSRALQLFVMDEGGTNVEKTGHLNVAGALHPVILKDGRLLFSSLESQGNRNGILWGIWSIHPDGTNWNPVVSAFSTAHGAPNAFHFQSQLSDGSLIVEEYYNQNTAGFGTYFKVPATPPTGTPAFGPAVPPADPRMAYLGGSGGSSGPVNMPFRPYGMESLTRFATGGDDASASSDRKDPKSLRLGKVTHPCGAPGNHLLTVWTAGAGPSKEGLKGGPATDAGIYLIKNGAPIWQPGEMLLIKNDPKFNEQWPRPLVPYERVYGVKEPARLVHRNDGKKTPHLPEGTPFGLVGTSSMYKRETYPFGTVPKDGVTARGNPYAAFGGNPWNGMNWAQQGADAGLYDNGDIHAVRIVSMEPASLPVAGLFYNHAFERLRILGEIPVRKFGPSPEGKGEVQPLDPDGNPDTSFLAKIPADVAFTFQTLDKDGLLLNMAQTWHQLRPGEVRNDCGGCHAHSQKPTPFEKTAAARPDYKVFDLTTRTPLLTAKANDESKRQWDKEDVTGLRHANGALDVEWHRDIKPILTRSCVACHTANSDKPAGGLALDDEKPIPGGYEGDSRHSGTLPASYRLLAQGGHSATRYIQRFQARRSLLVWKLLGRRADGLPDKPIKGREHDHGNATRIDFKGSVMPPADAVKAGKVKPLSDEDKRMLFRWIDLGCPIDRDYDAKQPEKRGRGWRLDDQRPTLTIAVPQPGANAALTRIVVGMHDYYTGLDPASFAVTADFPLDGRKAGENLAAGFKEKSPGVVEFKLATPVKKLQRGTLTVSVKDRQGNVSRIERTISIE